MKKKGLICLILTGMLLTGCSKDPGLKAGEIESNTLFVDKKGTVFCGVVESFEKEYYDEEELKDCLEEWIESYNTEEGEKRVELKSFLVEDKEASMVVRYETMEDYAKVNQTEARLLSYEEAESQGLLPETMVNMADGSTVESDALEAEAENKVLLIQEEYDVVLKGKVLYYQNSALKSTDSVHTTGNEISIIIFK